MATVVTGASGHIGVNLVRALLQRGESVRTVVHMDTSALEGLDVELVRGDVCELSSLGRCFAGAATVYHLAGHIAISKEKGSRMEAVNVEGTRNVVRACVECGVGRLLHVSSIHAMADPDRNAVLDERSPLVCGVGNPPYDRTKALGEKVVLDAVEQGLDAVVVAPTAVVGPYDYRPSYFGRVVLTMARGRMPIVMSGGFDWVDVRDVVAGAIAAADHAHAGSKYLLSGQWRPLTDVARIVARITGTTGPRAVVPRALAQVCSPLAESVCTLVGRTPLYTPYSVHALCGHRLVSHGRAAADLQYAPRPLDETLVDTCRWFEDNGYLPRGACKEMSA
jgi:dihydroflavonol-4-reductase